MPRFTAYYWIVGVSVPPPNSCLRVVLLADLHVGGAQAVIYGLRGHSEVARLTDPAGCVLQVIVQSGRQPSVLQKLCQLPFQYFSHPHLIRVLFPSLISACYNNDHNKVILQQEMSCVLLATFIQVSVRTKTPVAPETAPEGFKCPRGGCAALNKPTTPTVLPLPPHHPSESLTGRLLQR